MKQILIESTDRVMDASMLEQGAGILNLRKALDRTKENPSRRLSVFPSMLNLSNSNPYTYPYSIQPLYPNQMPLILNLTVLNSVYSKSKISSIQWETNSTLKDAVLVRAK